MCALILSILIKVVQIPKNKSSKIRVRVVSTSRHPPQLLFTRAERVDDLSNHMVEIRILSGAGDDSSTSNLFSL